MKTSIIISATLAVCSLCFTSCEKDSFTEIIRPETSNLSIHSDVATSSLKGEPFEFNQIVTLSAEDVVGDSDRLGLEGGEGNMERFVKSQSGTAIVGFGDSHILNIGSWYVELDLLYDASSNRVTGTIDFTFPDWGDGVTFQVIGHPAIVKNSSNNSLQMEMALNIVEGTGRFENQVFEGSAVLLDIASLLHGSGELSTSLVVEGEMIERSSNIF